ncbi:SDR family oxidoreductase [Roseateles sp.]|uniref:SDR family oxidoreductase n=1 Tax=Roseateles sp. TaxID=1971397 RepID=UPI0025E7CCA6|nr:SDR family oxidoreductase [Roseateles sp.]MBV8037285.1 SDR family oxidoreductase [Roseateles sp.]
MQVAPVVLVTGSARRLGRAIALELAGHGYAIAAHYHQSAQDAEALVSEAEGLGVRARAFMADLSDEAACRALLPAVRAHFGRVDAVVNNASLFVHDSVDSFSYAGMDAHWRANTAPAIVLARALREACIAQGSQGCVVNLLDQKLWNPNPDHLSYTLSKAALESSTTLLAQALAPQVRVCGVAPGITLPSGPMSDEEFTRAHGMTPLGRSSTAQDVAQAVRFLLQAQAITGTTLLVDGGQHLAPQPRDVLYLLQPD